MHVCSTSVYVGNMYVGNMYMYICKYVYMCWVSADQIKRRSSLAGQKSFFVGGGRVEDAFNSHDAWLHA